MKKTKQALSHSVIALLLCISMLIGTTYAWFTDSVTSGSNIIKSGSLDLEMYWTDDLAEGTWHNVEDPDYNKIFDYDNWEPGYTEVRYVKLVNAGNLALNYELTLTPEGSVGKLAEVINVYSAQGGVEVKERADLSKLGAMGLLNNVLNGGATASGTLLAEGQESPLHDTKETIVTLAMSMITTAGNDYQDESVGDGFSIKALATQCPFEEDSFGSDYDSNAEFPVSLVGSSASAAVKVVDGKVAEAVTIVGNGISAKVPAGVAVKDGVDKLTVKITPLESTTTDITVVNNEILIPVDVHIEGVAEGNTTPIIVDLGTILPKYLNMGNYLLIHVEDGVNNTMTLVNDPANLTAHNQYTYDPLTGAVSVAMASFSEVALIATDAKWEGGEDYDWYDTAKTELTICNADQLHAFAKIVGGMAKITVDNEIKTIAADSFKGKSIKLLSDINLNNGTVLDNADGTTKTIFYPIGYNNNKNFTSGNEVNRPTEAYTDVTSGVCSFDGIFDGNGHTISNFYQNTWEMFGDYNSGYTGTPNYYKDAMGLFGYVNGGTVKNLTVDNFSSDGEFTPTGVIAAYADGDSTFENIAITNCNPRVYNTGNGGIIGIAGDTSTADDDHITLKNITVDNSNKISALWGSWDVACGGLVGMYRGNVDGSGNATGDTISFTNCHVAAQIDVYNDVCANYQYYAYRYAGMIIGSVRHNTKNADGKTIPNMTGISASGCTVNYGDWNDYYYCEFEKNSMASYSEDYQFSRVDKSEIVFDDNGNITGCTHEHTAAEDKKAVYLPFHQLFTGYSWGVSSIGLKEYSGIVTDLGIVEDDENASVKKFEKSTNAQDAYKTGTTVTIGELFAAIENAGVEIDTDNVQVTVSPAYGTDSTADGTYTPNTTDWKKGTLTFNGIGAAVVIITDYYYCTPTKLTLTVAEPDSVDKFDLVFENTDDYLYRVGNTNTVALGSLFKAKEGVEIGDVSITVEALNGATVSGAYTANSSDWTKGTIQFDGTGPVLVTIDDDAYANEQVLYLEVVNATNVTAYSGLKNQNSVLLNDITMSSNSAYFLSSATLYGNGFTFDVTQGAYTGNGQISSNYVVCLSNATLDNIEVVGAVYTQYGAQAANDYNRAAVLSVNNNTIINSYISNCASAVRVKDGNLEIVNSTIKGGNFANIDIRGGHVVLDNVTTINQVNGNDKAEDDTVVVGLGVVVYYENVLNTTTIEIKNGITQYNYLSESQAEDYIKDATAETLTKAMFGTDYSDVQYKNSEDTWVNTGILSMTDAVDDDNITDVDGYVDASPCMTGTTGYLHTKKPDATSIAATAPTYKTVGQGAIAPSYSFDYTDKNYVAKTDGSNDYCYQQDGTVYVSMDAGDTVNWDTSILTATKNGQTLDYTVSMGGTDYTGKNIAFNTVGNYVVTYTYMDSNNYGMDKDGKITTYSQEYTKTVHVSVSVIEATTKHAEFTFGSSNTATEKITVDNATYVSAKGVTADNTTWTYMTIGDKKIYYPIVAAKLTSTKGSSSYAYFPVFENVVTITDYADNGNGDAFTYNSSTTTLPSTLTAVKGIYKAASDVPYWYNLTNSNLTQSGASKIFKWASSSDAPSDPTTYNNVLCYKSPQISADRVAYITLVQYSYTDSTNTTYYYYVGYTLEAFTKQTTCVTPDTLVTLADGSQKRIDQVTYADQLMVWDFNTGAYTVMPSSIVMNHGYDNYEVVTVNFEDGTSVNTINGHGFFDLDEKQFVILSRSNVEQYVGHRFVKQDGSVVRLVDYSIKNEYTESWSILTAVHYNCILEGMLTLTPAEVEGSPEYLMPYEIGEDMKYDQAKMQADIEKYGLYTYDDFKDYMTYEQFAALNLANFKVSVGKGFITWDEILSLIKIHIG